MIKSFKHKGLEQFYLSDSKRGIIFSHRNRLRMILTLLDISRSPAELDVPGLKLHPLKGADLGRWAGWVNRNWRVTFRF